MITIGWMLILFGISGLGYTFMESGQSDMKVMGAIESVVKAGGHSIQFDATRNMEIIQLASIACIIMGAVLIYVEKQKEVQNNKKGDQNSFVEKFNDKQNTQTTKELLTIFPPEIYDELKYIFNSNAVLMIKEFPELEQGCSNWKCSCGYRNREETCRICGMTYDILNEKLNYSYINNHRTERLKKESEIREKIVQERIEEMNQERIRKKEILEERKEYIKKHLKESKNVFGTNIKKVKELIKISLNKFIFPIINSIKNPHNKKQVTIIGLIIFSCVVTKLYFTNTDNGKIILLNYKGKHWTEQDLIKSKEFFMKSNQIRINETALFELISIALKEKEFQTVRKYFREYEEFCQNSTKIMNLRETLVPDSPTPNLEEGIYNEPQMLKLLMNEDQYGSKVMIKEISDENIQQYNSPIELKENRVYRFEIWSKNDLDFESDHRLYVYTMKLPIPKDVMVNIKGGVYKQEQNIELKSPENLNIYYTIDGRVPDKTSLLYSKPIRISTGVTNLKAICYNDMGVSSQIINEVYKIKKSTNGSLFLGGKHYSGYYYDYVATNDGIYAYTKERTEGFIIDPSKNARSLNEYGDKLFFLTSEGLVRSVDVLNEETEIIHNINASLMAIIHDSIYYKDKIDGHLYRAEMDGSQRSVISDAEVLSMDVDEKNNFLYFSIDGQGVYYIDRKNGNMNKTALNKQAHAYYFLGDKIYYSNGADLIKVENGIETVIKNFSYRNADMENWMSTTSMTWITKYDAIKACNKKLYFRENTMSSQDRTSIEGRNTYDSGHSYKWYQFNLDTEEIYQTEILTEQLYLSDDAIFDEDMNYYPVVH